MSSDEPNIPEPIPLNDEVPSTTDDRTMAMLCHLGGMLTGFLVPLIIWLIKKDQSRFVDDQGKEALNFQISLLIYLLITIPIGIVTCGFGFVLTFAVAIYGMVMAIIAAVKSNSGECYRYPLTLRLIS
jgi:uncharacterized Tic20 family protein